MWNKPYSQLILRTIMSHILWVFNFAIFRDYFKRILRVFQISQGGGLISRGFTVISNRDILFDSHKLEWIGYLKM